MSQPILHLADQMHRSWGAATACARTARELFEAGTVDGCLPNPAPAEGLSQNPFRPLGGQFQEGAA